MGKGDKKSKKGKRWRGSFGNSRKKSEIKARIRRGTIGKPVTLAVPVLAAVVAVEVKPKAKRTTKKKTETAE